ncbi:12631_t:CDS:2, partial [Gigaspora margarita]
SKFSNISSDKMLEETEIINKKEAEEIIKKLKKLQKTTCLYRKFNNSDQDDESSEGSSLNESHQILESEESDLDNKRCQDTEMIEYKDVKNIKNTIK